jgi:hypothetical protein
MDKLGHIYSSYLQTNLIFLGAKWTGLRNKQSVYYALGISSLFQTTIEVMDGFSKGWGFSWSDITANVTGNSFFLIQQIIWNEQKMNLKFSTHPVDYSSLDNEVQTRVHSIFGQTLAENLLKDYNGQTYWLSFNPFDLVNKKSNYWPSFVQISFGYGAQGMLGAYRNNWYTNEQLYYLDDHIVRRYNQYYLSFDIDWRKIPVRNKLIKSLFSVLNIIKIPAPTLEYNSLHQTKFHWLLF